MDTVYTPTDADREALREPRGEVVAGERLRDRVEEEQVSQLIAVGDRVSMDLTSWGAPLDVAVVDGRIQREPIDEQRLDALAADIETAAANPAGRITAEAWTAVREAVARTCSTALRVDGEEDLLALPAVTFAPPDAAVVYGQRDRGAVILHPLDEVKRFVERLVQHRAYRTVIVGGTWDRLHAGHRSLLLEAFARGGDVDIGVTTDSYVQESKDAADIQPYREREAAVASFLDAFGLRDRASIIPIDSYRGNAVEEGDALAVTPETVDTGRQINREREETGKRPLDLVEVPLVTGEDGGPVSSSRIRAGEIDVNGLAT